MNDLRTAAQQALEALKSDPNAVVEVAEGRWKLKRDLAISALRSALAEPTCKDALQVPPEVAATMTTTDIAWLSTHRLVNLWKEFGQMRWAGEDDGWDRAIDAVRNRLDKECQEVLDWKSNADQSQATAVELLRKMQGLKMTTLREAAQQALEALDEAATFHRNLPDQHARRLAAMTALRERLAQPVQEPDYWQEEARRYAGNADYWRKRYEALAEPVQEPDSPERRCGGLGCDGTCCQPVQEPVAWLTGCPECGMDGGCDCPSGTWNPPQRKPLSDEEIESHLKSAEALAAAIRAMGQA